MKEAGFEFKNHTADIKVKCWGKTIEEAYSQAALSLMTIITPNLKKINPNIEKKIKIISEDKYALLFDFLSEFLYLFDVNELIFNDIKVESIKKIQDEFELKTTLKGEKFNRNKHEIGTEVKAITYSYMVIEEKKNKIEIEVTFDI